MDLLSGALAYGLAHQTEFLGELRTHLTLSGLALALALLIGVPLGILTSRWGTGGRLILNGVGVARVIPSIAVLFLLLPVFGLGFWPALLALTLLACPPILINTDAGLRAVDPAVVEAGRGLGLSAGRLLREVQLPLALPIILTGVRTSAVEVIASAALAALTGGGGLGVFILEGLALNRNTILLVGALPVALLALTVELGLAALQRRVTVPARA